MFIYLQSMRKLKDTFYHRPTHPTRPIKVQSAQLKPPTKTQILCPPPPRKWTYPPPKLKFYTPLPTQKIKIFDPQPQLEI